MTDRDDRRIRVAEHPLVRDIVDNTGDPPQLALLIGFAGESSRRDHTRLYLDDELRSWAEIPTCAVRRSAKLRRSVAYPWGGTALWVGFADPDDLERYPVLFCGEEHEKITDFRDLRALGRVTATQKEKEKEKDVEGRGGRPGGGPSATTYPKDPPPPPPRR